MKLNTYIFLISVSAIGIGMYHIKPESSSFEQTIVFKSNTQISLIDISKDNVLNIAESVSENNSAPLPPTQKISINTEDVIVTPSAEISVQKEVVTDKNISSETLPPEIKITPVVDAKIPSPVIVRLLPGSIGLNSPMERFTTNAEIRLEPQITSEEVEKVKTSESEKIATFKKVLGLWTITGFTLEKNSRIQCSIETKSSNGSSFAYLVEAIKNNDDITTRASFLLGTTVPDGKEAVLTLSFDKLLGMQIPATARDGALEMTLPEDPAIMQKAYSSLRQANGLVINEVSTNKSIYIDLHDSSEAALIMGECLKTGITHF